MTERFRRVPLRIDGPVVVEPAVFRDPRGFFVETFRHNALAEHGIPVDGFVQENQSRSSRGVLRGMHFAVGDPAMGKLVRCARGRILDVVVDLRRGSSTFGQWEAVELDDETLRMCWVPVGFAHGFCVVSDVADVLYKQTAYYDPAVERAIAYDDPDVGIQWPAGIDFVVSERDAGAPRLSEVAADLPFS